MDRLVEQLVADEDDQREETELEVVKLNRGLSFIGADDKEWEKDGEQAATDDI